MVGILREEDHKREELSPRLHDSLWAVALVYRFDGHAVAIVSRSCSAHAIAAARVAKAPWLMNSSPRSQNCASHPPLSPWNHSSPSTCRPFLRSDQTPSPALTGVARVTWPSRAARRLTW